MELQKIKELIEKHDKIVLFHHKMPDGDSISSSYALVKAIQKKYPEKTVGWMPEKPYVEKRFPYLNIDLTKDIIEDVDDSFLAIIGDVSQKERIHNYEYLAKAGAIICFDHHRNESNINPTIFWHEPTWPASAIQSYMIAKELDIHWNERLALLFYFGIMTDTYRFAYSLANPLPLKASAELFEHISDVDLGNLYQAMEAKEEKMLRFQGWVLNNFTRDGEVAYQVIKKEDQDKLNVDPDDCARVNFLANIKGVKVWMFFIQYPDFIRVEFRSTGTPVNEIAMQFNGGGHIKAAGTQLDTFDKVKDVVNAAKKAASQN